MKQKGFTLIELLIVIVIIMIIGSLLVPAFFKFMEDEKANQEPTNLLQFKKEAKVETKFINNSRINCLDGKQTITINGVVYHLGLIKNSWGDLEGVDCQ
jgi:prepilin-type N-terminal cleavage/methylation domain-containing protein